MLETLQLKHTPFHERTSRLSIAQNWRRWAGHIVVGSYDLQIDHEYWAIRDGAALIDISPLMKYLIEGKDAARLLNKVTTARYLQDGGRSGLLYRLVRRRRARCSTTARSRGWTNSASA
jgi:glycine cleavage system aminomethyltransferase T